MQALCSPGAAGKPAWGRKLTGWLIREKDRKDIPSGELRTAETGKWLRMSSSLGPRAEHLRDCILCSPPHRENPRLWWRHGVETRAVNTAHPELMRQSQP